MADPVMRGAQTAAEALYAQLHSRTPPSLAQAAELIWRHVRAALDGEAVAPFRAALERIVFEPFGGPEATHAELLAAITDCARAALEREEP